MADLAKSPHPKTPKTAKQLTPAKGMPPGLPPGFPPMAGNNNAQPMVVLMVQGENPGVLLDKLSKQKKKKKKKSKKSKNKKKKGSRTISKEDRTTSKEDEHSDSDRATTPDLPNAHRRAPAHGISVAPPMVVDKNCVPQNIVIDGPAGCPIVVSLDAKDSKGQYANEAMPLTRAPAQVTRGWMFTDSKSLIQFKPDHGKDAAPPSSTRGILTKMLADTSVFVSDSGPQLPEYAAGRCGQETKDKVGDAIPVSGFVELNPPTGTCRFKLITSNTPAPFHPPNASMGVLVREPESRYVFFVPTEGRPVGPILGTAAPIPEKKKVAEGTMIGQIVKSICGTPKWEQFSDKANNVLGYVMSSATGVPIYIPLPAEERTQVVGGSTIKDSAPQSTWTAPIVRPSKENSPDDDDKDENEEATPSTTNQKDPSVVPATTPSKQNQQAPGVKPATTPAKPNQQDPAAKPATTPSKPNQQAPAAKPASNPGTTKQQAPEAKPATTPSKSNKQDPGVKTATTPAKTKPAAEVKPATTPSRSNQRGPIVKPVATPSKPNKQDQGVKPATTPSKPNQQVPWVKPTTTPATTKQQAPEAKPATTPSKSNKQEVKPEAAPSTPTQQASGVDTETNPAKLNEQAPVVKSATAPDQHNQQALDAKPETTPDSPNQESSDAEPAAAPEKSNEQAPDDKPEATPVTTNEQAPDEKSENTPDTPNQQAPDVKPATTPSTPSQPAPDAKHDEVKAEKPAPTPAKKVQDFDSVACPEKSADSQANAEKINSEYKKFLDDRSAYM